MNKQNDLILMEQTLGEAAVSKRTPWRSLLKYALLGVTAFIALIILFAVGSSLINPAVDSVMQKMGLGDKIVAAETSPVAYAWTNPTRSDVSGENYQSNFTSMTSASASSSLRPTTAHSGWNYGYKVASGSGYTINSDGSLQSLGGAGKYDVKILFYVDIYVDDLAQHAIKNDQITTCSVTLKVSQVGTANAWDCGTIYGTFFLCSSATGSSGAAVGNMSSDFLATSCDKFDDGCGYGRNDYSASMSIALSGTERKIRFGLYYRCEVTSTGLFGTADIFAPAPEITTNFTTDTYKNGKIQFSLGGVGSTGGSIVPTTSGTYNNAATIGSTTYTAAFSAEAGMAFGGIVIGDVKAVPKEGYYFSGWKITSGSMTSSYNLRTTTLDINGGPYLINGNSATVKITASFRAIPRTNTGLDWTYLQQLNSDGTLYLDGNGKPVSISQGPSCSTPTTNDSGTSGTFVLTGGTYNDGVVNCSSTLNVYTGTINGGTQYNSKTTAPSEAGTYRIVVGIFASGSQSDSSMILGYYTEEFVISQVSVAGGDTTSNSIPSRTYSSYAYQPNPSYIDIVAKENSRPYRLINGTDYETIGSWSNNINVGNSAFLTFTTTAKNFTGENSVYFSITPLDVGTLTYVTAMAEEIKDKYGVVYTGYEQRPDVILLQYKGDVPGAGGLDATAIETTFIIYATKYTSYYGNYGYEALSTDGAVMATYSYYQIVNADVAPSGGTIDVTKAYSNNVDVCTYDGSNTSCASFSIQMARGNMTGTAVAYFDIAPFNLNSYSGGTITVEKQATELVYNSLEQTPVPDIVYITVSGRSIWYYNENMGAYTSTAPDITYCFSRVDATVEYTDEIKNKSGTPGYLFNTWNNSFENSFTYANNVNVSYDESGNRIAAAEIAVTLRAGGNIEGEITTLFEITPLSLAAEAGYTGNTTKQTVGYIAQQGASLVESYTGEERTPTPTVQAYPKNTQDRVTLTEGKDYEYSYENNVNVSRNAVVIVTGKGNYKDSVSAYFYIVAMDATGAVAKNLTDEEYTGKVKSPTPSTITFTINNKEFTLNAGTDYKIVEGIGSNTAVSDASSGNNYITISFTGYNPKGDNKGNVEFGTSGNFYGENIKVYFSIVPKDLNNILAENVYAEWGNLYPDRVTYDGTPKTNLPIVSGNTDKTANTLYIIDTDANAAAQLKYGETADVDGADYTIKEGSWGENINAGKGSVIVVGVGNYTGERTIYFNIYARDITIGVNVNTIGLDTSLGYDNNLGGYYYTGKIITPAVSFVRDGSIFTDISDTNDREGKQALKEGVDFEVIYGDGSTPPYALNYSVLKGGKVTIKGKGNYKESVETTFKILPIDQKVYFENPYSNSANSHLKEESLATDSTKAVYADYEVNADEGKKIQIIAYTTAIYPEPRRVTFQIRTITNTVSTVASIEYEKVELATYNGVQMSKTTAYISFTGGVYGIMRVYAEQYDNNTPLGEPYTDNDLKVGEAQYYNYGNYNAYTFTEGKDSLYAIYAKRQDSTSSAFAKTVSKVYGNDDFKITPGLDSYTNYSFEYLIESDTPSVVDVSGTTTGADRSGRVGNVGTANIKIYHGGHVDYNDDSKAYMAFEVTQTVTVKKRTLNISFEELEIPYGTNPKAEGTPDIYTFKFTYETKSGAYTEADSYTGLYLANGKIDKIEDILTGYSVGYDSSLHGAVNTDGYLINVVGVESEITKGPLYDNYDIYYIANLLKVTKKELTVTVTNGSAADTIFKTYGSANPENYTLSYSGFVTGDSEATLAADIYFNAPSIDYGSVNAATGVGGHTVYLKGGQASNYYFNEKAVTVNITRANVVISLESVAKDYDGYAVTPGAVTIKGVEVDVDGDGDIDTTEPIIDDTTGIAYRYIGTNYDSPLAPTLAGNYSVRVTFTASSAVGENYQTTVQTFQNAIVINKVAPVITYSGSGVQVEYTANPINLALVQPIISGIPNGRVPLDVNPNKILFALSGTAPEDCLENGSYLDYFTDTAPTDVGFYDVIIVYVANASDVYTDTMVRFNEIVEITTGLANINIMSARSTFDYDGSAHTLSLESDFYPITWTNTATGETIELSKNNAVLEYYVDGEWGTEAPKNVGIYSIRVTYNPAEGEQVAKTTANFINAIEIKAYDLASGNHIALSFTGIRTYSYNSLGHPLAESDIVVKGTATDEANGIAPQGIISVVYVKNGISYSEPVNAGSYTAIVTYTPANIDNYYASTTKNLGMVITISAAGVAINSDSSFTYAYNGSGRAMEGVSYHGVVLPDGSFERPQGTLSYTYRLSGTTGAFLSDLPTDAGVYDVRITYNPVTDDNYMSAGAVEFQGVITIERVNPSIVINKMTFNYGEEIKVDYTIRGAQYDLNGPMNEINAGLGAVEIQYGTRYTTASGGTGYDWSTTAPTESGKYSVRITFVSASVGSNYESATQTGYDILTIANIIPTFELDGKSVVYDGNRHASAGARVYDTNGYEYVKWTEGAEEGLNYYRGTLGYEYRKSGTNTWSTLAPSAVGVYDVRVRYYENAASDVFSSATETYLAVLEIEALVITVMPIYGQGHVYDGTATDGDAIAYVYSYERDGYKYMVYTSVGDLDKNELIDLSKAEYVDSLGHVYAIVTDASLVTDAWRDYYERELTLVAGSFSDGEELVSFDFASFGVTEGKAAYTSASGKDYVIDLDLDVVYLNDGVDYTLGVQSGYYFSVVDGEGAVNVIEIIPSNIVYASSDRTQGIYTVTTAGKQTLYTVNLTTMQATANGEIYDIFRSVGIVSYVSGSSTVQVKVDYNSLYYVTADGRAIYKSAGGQAYLINLNTSEVERIAVLNVDSVEFSYYDYIGEEITLTVDTASLSSIYASNAYIGAYAIRDDLSAIIDLKAGTARIQTYYTLKDNGSGMYSFTDKNGSDDILTLGDLIKTSKSGTYLYYSPYGSTYYVDVVDFKVRNIENLFKFDVKDARIYQEVDGAEVGFDVDIRSLRYNIVRNGKLYSTTSLYGAEYDVEEATLISSNSWSGSLSLMAQGAGSYGITQGSLLVSSNYQLVFVEGITFDIERAKLTVSFSGDKNAVYDGENKFIEYNIEGVLAGDSVGVTQSYDGDNLNVTASGYRTVVSINTPNYYLEGGVSDWYYIKPATMQAIVAPENKPVIYDGGKHYLELGEVEKGATVTYAGSETSPYFIEPGTYSVIATVSKPNYESLEVELTLTITKAKYEVNALEVPGTLTYGDALPALRTDSDLGTIALDPGQILLPSQTTYTWTFTPYSQEFYKFYEGNSADGNTITGTIELKVQKAQAQIQVNGNLVQSETSPSAILGIANGLTNNESELVTIEYIAGDGTRYAKMPTSPGKYTVRVTYAGDENYAETVYTTVLTIEQESNYEWLIVVGAVLLGLTIFSTVFFLVRKQKKFN